MANIGRKSQNNPYFRQEYQSAKNRYFNAIKRAKTDYWNQFLEKEDPQSIFKAIAYTKDIMVQPIPNIRNIRTDALETEFMGQCDAFRTALFPDPPTAPDIDFSAYLGDPDWNWPILSNIELENACILKIKGKTPGPDLITQEIITQAYNTIPDIFFQVYSILINTGYHPKS